MSYILSSAFDIAQTERALWILKEAVTGRASSSETIGYLQEEGLGYRRQNMLDDYRRAQAIENTRTPEARINAEKWYEDVIEPTRTKYGLTGSEMSEIWNKLKTGEEIPDEYEVIAEEIEEKYEEMSLED